MYIDHGDGVGPEGPVWVGTDPHPSLVWDTQSRRPVTHWTTRRTYYSLLKI